MQIEGPKKLVKRAVFAARVLDIWDFNLRIEWSDSSYCQAHDDGSFTIGVDNLTHKSGLIEIIAHEMTHLRQYKRDQLREEQAGIVIWEGEKYLDAGPESDLYWLSPWEMEARANQDWIAYRWDKRKYELQ